MCARTFSGLSAPEHPVMPSSALQLIHFASWHHLVATGATSALPGSSSTPAPHPIERAHFPHLICVVYWYSIRSPLHRSGYASLGRVCTWRKASPPPPSFTQYPSPPRSLVRDGQTSPLGCVCFMGPRLVVSRSTCPGPLLTPSNVQSRRAPPLINNCHDARFSPHVGDNVNAG